MASSFPEASHVTSNDHLAVAPSAPGKRLAAPFAAVAILALAAGAANFSRLSLGPLQEALRSSLALSDNQVALLQGPALNMPILALSLPLGLLIDHSSRKRLLLWFFAASLAGTLVSAAAPDFVVLLIGRAIVGTAATATAIAIYSLLADLVSPARRGRATTLMAMGQAGGASAAFALGGHLLALHSENGDAWRHALGWMALAAPLAFAALLFVREPTRPTRPAERSSRLVLADLREYRGLLAALLGGMMLVGLADGAAFVWTSPTLLRIYHMTPEGAGRLLGIVLLASGIAGPILGGVLADWCHKRGGSAATIGMVALLALISAGAGLFALAPTPIIFAVGLGLFVAIGAVTSIMIITLTTIAMPPAVRALCVSILFAGTMVAAGLAPLSVSLLTSVLGGESSVHLALALVCTVTSLLAGVALWSCRKRAPERATA